MGIHRYEGNKKHSFREFRENCNWCQGYTTNGYNLVFPTEKNGVHYIETYFCSPKCYHESIEKSHATNGYFELVVSSFIDGGGIEKYEHRRKTERIREDGERRIKNEKEVEIKKKLIPIKILITVIALMVSYFLFKWVITVHH